MDNNAHWRGRGRGRGNNRGGRGRGQSHDQPSSSIMSRLGPVSIPIDDAPPPVERDGRAFSKNNTHRGRGRGGGGFNSRRFENEFVEEDIEMRPGDTSDFVVIVEGHPKGSEKTLIDFLTRKCKVPWQPINVDYRGSAVHITVASRHESNALSRLDNYEFRGVNLSITQKLGDNQRGKRKYESNTTNGSSGGGGSSYLIEFIQNRWNAQSGFLDMEELPPTSHSIARVISQLLREAKQLFGDSVTTISFAKNKLYSVAPIDMIADTFPNLKNLSLRDNEIAEYHGLDRLSNKKIQLHELVLSGNPIQTKSDYRSEVIKRFPSIQYLDSEPIQLAGQPAFQQPQTASLGVPVLSNFFDQDSSRMVAQDMLSKYFPIFDSNRAALIDLYEAQSTFSVVFSHGNYSQENVWGSSQVKPTQRIIVGNEAIVKRLCSLPATFHDLSRAENFVTDAWQVPGTQPTYPVVLFLTVHGEFNELPIGTTFSFDRTLVVAPSTPGSRAHTAGWSYVILTDSLIVRPFSCKPASLLTV
ncbi:hypothetical protein BY458DRAFT_589164 [Sporodiniella umbellata]|nr:hypothetical protein BY458DRAFT_589164 [Sporodiniella umbellata]